MQLHTMFNWKQFMFNFAKISINDYRNVIIKSNIYLHSSLFNSNVSNSAYAYYLLNRTYV